MLANRALRRPIVGEIFSASLIHRFNITDNGTTQDLASGVLRNTFHVKFQKTSGAGSAGEKEVRAMV